MSFKVPFRNVAVLGLVLTLGAVVPARAQEAVPKIAIIDVQRIITESQTGKRALAGLEAFSKAEQTKLQAQNEELKKLHDRISQGSLSLAQEALAELQQEVDTTTTNLRRSSEDASQRVEKKQQETLRGIEAKVMPVIQQVGRDEGYTMILRKFESGLIFASEQIDITVRVIELLDAANPPASTP